MQYGDGDVCPRIVALSRHSAKQKPIKCLQNKGIIHPASKTVNLLAYAFAGSNPAPTTTSKQAGRPSQHDKPPGQRGKLMTRSNVVSRANAVNSTCRRGVRKLFLPNEVRGKIVAGTEKDSSWIRPRVHTVIPLRPAGPATGVARYFPRWP
jgi:hypothetical protein